VRRYRWILAIVMMMTRVAAAGSAPLAFAPGERVMVLSPHPDDESLGCGGVLHDAVRAGIPVHVVFLTNGDANELSFLVWEKHPVVVPSAVIAMGQTRGQEALNAAHALGLPADAVTFLGYPDAGTMAMWTGCWGDRPPHRSLLTRATAVPYETALRPGAPYKPEEVMRDLQTVLRKFRPTRIFVSHPADAHPDHRAWYLYATATLWETPDLPTPAVHPFLIHHRHWPVPAGDPPATPLVPPPLLGYEITWQRRPLDAADQEAKRNALEAHATQIAYSRDFMLGFVRANELFGDFAAASLEQPDAVDDLKAGAVAAVPDPRAQVPQQVRESFVGIEWQRVARTGDTLTFTAELSRRLLPGTHVTFHLFGARSDRPFADMPKIRVTVSAFGHEVSDQNTPLPTAGADVTHAEKLVTVRLPLAVLGNPQRLFAGAETIVADLLMHPAAWRIVELGPWTESLTVQTHSGTQLPSIPGREP
jgi:LmbE family N-acetylglucosaminyl deacetylase